MILPIPCSLHKMRKLTCVKSQKLSPSLIPPGWSAHPAHLWRASKGFPKSSYGIDESLPVIPIVVDRGACPLCLVECPEGTYYLWNQMSDDVWEVVSPARLEDIVPKLNDPDLKGMEIRELEDLGGEVEIADPIKCWGT